MIAGIVSLLLTFRAVQSFLLVLLFEFEDTPVYFSVRIVIIIILIVFKLIILLLIMLIHLILRSSTVLFLFFADIADTLTLHKVAELCEPTNYVWEAVPDQLRQGSRVCIYYGCQAKDYSKQLEFVMR